MPVEKIRNLVRYRGYVQGVGFRMTAVAQARGLPVHGIVRNEPDGSVLMDVEGSSRDIRELMRRIASAMNGNIEETLVESRQPRGVEKGFHIQH